MPTAEELGYIGAFTGAIVGIAAVVGLIYVLVKKLLRGVDLIDGAREFFIQAQGRPATRDDPGEPNLMEQVRLLRIEQVAQRETLDSLVEWRTGQPPRAARGQGGERRRGRPGL